MLRERQGHLRVPVSTGKTRLIHPHLSRSGGFCASTPRASVSSIGHFRTPGHRAGNNSPTSCGKRERQSVHLPAEETWLFPIRGSSVLTRGGGMPSLALPVIAVDKPPPAPPILLLLYSPLLLRCTSASAPDAGTTCLRSRGTNPSLVFLQDIR